MDETMKILQMLEDGKINADEAARLLEAVYIHKPRARRIGVDSEIVGNVMGGISSAIECIPMIIRHGHRLGSKSGKRTLSVKKRPAIRLNLVGGDLNLIPSEDDSVRGNLSSGIVTTKDARHELLIKCLGGDASLHVPRIQTLQASVVGGDIAGDVDVGDLNVKSLDGDIRLSLKTLKDATVKTKSGDISLSIPGDANAQVDAYTMSGDLEFDPELEIEEQTDNHVKGKMAEGKGKLIIRSLSGNIHVKSKDLE
ncbi:MAG: DUF4097 domain-containing protein [bacterium]